MAFFVKSSTLGSSFPSMSCSCCSFFFFFQAEDGIRDVAVTGVQTCALPIYCPMRRGLASRVNVATAEPTQARVRRTVPNAYVQCHLHSYRVSSPSFSLGS